MSNNAHCFLFIPFMLFKCVKSPLSDNMTILGAEMVRLPKRTIAGFWPV